MAICQKPLHDFVFFLNSFILNVLYNCLYCIRNIFDGTLIVATRTSPSSPVVVVMILPSGQADGGVFSLVTITMSPGARFASMLYHLFLIWSQVAKNCWRIFCRSPHMVRRLSMASAIAPFLEHSLDSIFGSHACGAVIGQHFAAHASSAGKPGESVQEMFDGHNFDYVQMDSPSDEADENHDPAFDGCRFAVCAVWLGCCSQLHCG